MKSWVFSTLTMVALLGCTRPVCAQIPDAPLDATVEVSNPQPFEKETFFITLTIITRGVEIRQQLDLTGLPDPSQIAIFTPFEAQPIERRIEGPLTLETRRYRARARGLVPGSVTLAPALRLTTQQRMRSLFGSMIEERPVNLTMPPALLNIKPLPPPPDDFCGAVGALQVEISVTPTELVAGDLLTVNTRIRGEGFMDGLRIPAIPEAPLLKTYPVKQVQTEAQQQVFAQTVIPKDEAVKEIPSLVMSTFDTTLGTYVTHRVGPFPLTYHHASTRVVEQFRPETTTPPDAQNQGSPAEGPSMAQRLKQRLAHEPHVIARATRSTAARMAPADGSLATFDIPADSDVQVIDRHEDWLLIEHRQQRGWIPAAALSQPGAAGPEPSEKVGKAGS